MLCVTVRKGELKEEKEEEEGEEKPDLQGETRSGKWSFSSKYQ